MVTCVVTFRRRPCQSRHNAQILRSTLTPRQKQHTCNPFLLLSLQTPAPANPFLCISYQKQGRGIPLLLFVNYSDNILVPALAPNFALLSSLESTLARHLASVASKRLTKNLTPLF